MQRAEAETAKLQMTRNAGRRRDEAHLKVRPVELKPVKRLRNRKRQAE